MKDNEYDFKMEWPDEYKDCENVPPATPEEMEGIMRAIAPVLRRNRIIHRTRLAVKYGGTLLTIGCCLFIGSKFFQTSLNSQHLPSKIAQTLTVPPTPALAATTVITPASADRPMVKRHQIMSKEIKVIQQPEIVKTGSGNRGFYEVDRQPKEEIHLSKGSSFGAGEQNGESPEEAVGLTNK